MLKPSFRLANMSSHVRQLGMSRLLNLIRASKSLRFAQNLSRPEMLALQERRWRGLVHHALKTSPFYRRHLAGIDPDRCALKDIPPLTKSALIKNWDEIVSDPRLRQAELKAYLDDSSNWGRLYHQRWMVCKTSGTSGKAIIFPHDVAAVDWMHAAHSVRNGTTAAQSIQPSWRPWQRRFRVVAFVRGGAPSTSSALFRTRPWIGALFARHFCINANSPWDTMLQSLRELRPDVLIVYASLLERLAHAQLAGQLQLDFSRPGATISTGGDRLTPRIRDLCRQAFGLNPLDGYGAAESPAIARQWSGVDHLMLLEDITVMESVNADGNAAQDGETGDHVLITPLINRAVPLLRYQLSDRICLGPVQPGWPFRRIDAILGRSSMSYQFYVPEERVVVGLDLLNGLEGDPRVKDTQLRQTDPRGIECLFSVVDGVDAERVAVEITAGMRSFLNARQCQKVSCSARHVPFLEPDPVTGKVERWLPLRPNLPQE